MATRITENYDSHTKDELLAEAQARGIPGVNTTSLKGEIVDALEDNDTEPDQPKPPLPKIKASNLPKVDPPVIPPAPGDAPNDEEYTEGIFKQKSSGEDFAVAVVDDAPNNRTHFAKNSLHFWNGTADEFELQFTKK